MLRNVTAELMGDPCATTRRPPTPEEMAKNCQFNRLEFKVRDRRVIVGRHPRSQLLNLPIGGWVIKPTKKGAASAMKYMRNYGLSCCCIPMGDGKFQVLRMP